MATSKQAIFTENEKAARSITGDSINILGEVVLTVILNGITKKLIAYVLKNTIYSVQIGLKTSTFGISLWARKLESPNTNTETLKHELK